MKELMDAVRRYVEGFNIGTGTCWLKAGNMVFQDMPLL